MINRRRPSPAPPFPSPPGGGGGADGCSEASALWEGKPAKQAVSGKSWRPWHWAIGASEPGILRAPGSHLSLPLHREHVCICFTLSPGRSP